MDRKGEIRDLLFRVEMARKRLLRQDFTELGFTLGRGQPRILSFLYEEDHITQSELAKRCELDVTTISRTLDKMVEAGWIRRLAKPGCRRSVLIEITEEGRKKAEAIRVLFARVDDRIWENFTEEEMEGVRQGLRKIYKNLCREEKVPGHNEPVS